MVRTWSRGRAVKTLSPGEERRWIGKETPKEEEEEEEEAGLSLGLVATLVGEWRVKGEELREVEDAISGQIR